MINTEIILDGFGKLIVEEGANFPLNFNVQDLTRPESTPSSYSKNITIIGDKNSNKILGQAYDVNITNSSFDINRKVACQVQQDGATVFDGGYFQLKKVIKTGESLPNGEPKIIYIAQVKSNLMNFFTQIKDKELTDLELGGFDDYEVLNRQNIIDSFTNTVDDVWKYVPLYKVVNTANFRAKEWKPAIFAKVLWDEIHAQSGFQYEFEELSGVSFDKLVIPYTGEFDADEDTKNFGTYIGDNGTFQQADLGCANNTLHNGERIKYGINNSEVVKITNDIQDNVDQFNPSNNRFTAAFSSNYNFKYSLNVEQVLNNTSSEIIEVEKEGIFGGPTRNLNISLGYRYVILRANGTTEYGAITRIANTGSDFSTFPGADTLNPGNQTIYNRDVSFEFDINLNVGDQVYDIRLVELWKNTQGSEDLQWGYGSILQGTFQFVDVCSIYNIYQTDLTVIPELEYNVGTPIYIQQFIPREIDQRDFVKSIIDMFKLVVDVDPENDNNLIYKTRDKFYDDGEEDDWTHKLDKKNPINLEWLVDKQTKKLKLSYTQDDDEFNKSYFNHIKDIYGEFEYDFSNDFNVGIKESKIIFSPTPIQYDSISNLYLPSLPLTEAEDLNIRILLDGGVRTGYWTLQNDDGSNSTQILSDYPYFGHLDNPEQPSLDINFGTCEFYFYNTWEFTTSNNLFNLYHRRYISQLTKGRMLTAHFNLTPTDILNIKSRLNKKIKINDAWYNINRIIDYNANSDAPTKVELVTIDDGVSIVPTIKIGTVKPNPTKPYVGTPVTKYGKDEVYKTNTISKGFVGEIYGEDNTATKESSGIIIGDKSTLGGTSMIIGDGSTDDGLSGKLVVGDNKIADAEYDAFIGDTKIGEDINLKEITFSRTGMTYDSGYIDNGYIDSGYFESGTGSFTFTTDSAATTTTAIGGDEVVFNTTNIDMSNVTNLNLSGVTISGITGEYLPITGGTMTGDITMSSGTKIGTTIDSDLGIVMEDIFGQSTMSLFTDGQAYTGSTLFLRSNGAFNATSQLGAYGNNGLIGLYTNTSYMELYNNGGVTLYSDGDLSLEGVNSIKLTSPFTGGTPVNNLSIDASGNIVTGSTVEGNYLPLSGGTMTGNINMDGGTSFTSSNGGGQLALDIYGSSEVMLDTNNGAYDSQQLYMSNGYIELSDYTPTGSMLLYSQGIDIAAGSGPLPAGANYVSVQANTASGKTFMGVNQVIDVIKITAEQGAAESTSATNKSGVAISTKNSDFNSSVRNSVILAADGITASANNTAYMQHSVNTGVAQFAEYTVGTVPSAAGYAGGMIAVTDETGGYTMAFSDGTNWRRVQDRAIIS